MGQSPRWRGMRKEVLERLRKWEKEHPQGAPPPVAAPDETEAERIEIDLGLPHALLTFLIAIPVSVAPRQWRERVSQDLPLSRGAIGSGILQVAAAFIFGAVAFMAYKEDLVNQAAAVSGGMLSNAETQADVAIAYTTASVQGMTIWFGFFFTLPGILALYAMLEGMARAVSAGVNGEVYGTLPLWVVSVVYDRIAVAKADRALGPRSPDIVTRDEQGRLARIEACRPHDWDNLSTVRYEERFYTLDRIELRASGNHRFIYHVSEIPESGYTIRGLFDYDPNEFVPPRKRSVKT